MKKFLLTGLLTACMVLTVAGCGRKNNSATEPSATPDVTGRPTDEPMATQTPDTDNRDNRDDNDLTDDVENGMDNIGDGVNDAVDGVGEGVKDAVDGAGEAVDDTVDGVQDATDELTGNDDNNKNRQ